MPVATLEERHETCACACNAARQLGRRVCRTTSDIPHRRAERPGRALRRHRRSWIRRGGKNGRRGLQARGEGIPRRGPLGRPPEQTRHWCGHRQAVVRRRPCRCHRRRADLLRRARRVEHCQREGQGLPDCQRRLLGSHRQALHAHERPLDLRHLGARQQHGPCGDQAGRSGMPWSAMPPKP